MAELEPSEKPISTIVIIIAMQAEALPLIKKFQLSETHDFLFPKGVPWIRYHGIYKNLHINLIWPGKDLSFGVDSVGTISASLVTYASIQALKPDLIINAGTSGGFKAKGACIGDVFLASDVAFHDRRIPIPVFDQYGIGARKIFSTPNILKELNLKASNKIVFSYSKIKTYHKKPYLAYHFNKGYLYVDYGEGCYREIRKPDYIRVIDWLKTLVLAPGEGKLSTGDSLDMSPHDEVSIVANNATLKDMEGAAVAYVADLLSIPAILVKAVTDIVDGDKPTAEEFLKNLVAVTAALDVAVTQVVDFISGKCLSEL